MKTVIIFFLLIQVSPGLAVIGADNRIEASQVPEPHLSVLPAVATMVRRNPNNLQTNGGYRFDPNYTYKNDANICSGQRYSNEITPAEVVCGSTLVAPDLIITARHCLSDSSNCAEDYSFVFDYTDGRQSFDRDQTYHCQEVMWKKNENGMDVALIRLDRAVVGRTPVPMRRASQLNEGDIVRLIGPQLKMPLKSSDGPVRFIENNQQVGYGSALDCNNNDSGSPIFNSRGEFSGVFFALGEPGAQQEQDNQSGTQREQNPNENRPGTVIRDGEIQPQLTADPKAGLVGQPAPQTQERCRSDDFYPDSGSRADFAPTDGNYQCMNGDCQITTIPSGCVFSPIDYFANEINPYIQASWQRWPAGTIRNVPTPPVSE